MWTCGHAERCHIFVLVCVLPESAKGTVQVRTTGMIQLIIQVTTGTKGTPREETLTAGMNLAARRAAQGTIAEKITDAAARIGSTMRKKIYQQDERAGKQGNL